MDIFRQDLAERNKSKFPFVEEGMRNGKVFGINNIVVEIQYVDVDGAGFVACIFVTHPATFVFDCLATQKRVVGGIFRFHYQYLVVEQIVRFKPPCFAGINSRFFYAVADMVGNVGFHVGEHFYFVAKVCS